VTLVVVSFSSGVFRPGCWFTWYSLFEKNEWETNTPSPKKATGRGSRPAETKIVKVLKSGQEPQRINLLQKHDKTNVLICQAIFE